MTMNDGRGAAAQGPDLEHADRELVLHALAHDTAAQSDLIQRLTPVINQRVRRSLLRHHAGTDRQEVADLRQDVFVRLFAKDGKVLRTWDPAAGLSLPGFVSLVARHEVASARRSRRRAPPPHDLSDPASLDEHAAPASRSLDSCVDSRERLEQMVQRLSEQVSPRGVDMFRRLFIDRDSPQQISKDTHLTLGSVYQWRTRLARVVRASMGGATAVPERSA
jgi:DNA-directed RNA polymerase specialized sigma24 family protein